MNEDLEQELAAAAIDLLDLRKEARLFGGAAILAGSGIAVFTENLPSALVLAAIGLALFGASRALHIWERNLVWQEDRLRHLTEISQTRASRDNSRV